MKIGVTQLELPPEIKFKDLTKPFQRDLVVRNWAFDIGSKVIKI